MPKKHFTVFSRSLHCDRGIFYALNSGFNSAEVAANSRQMANMQQGFGIQTAITSGINGLSSQFAQCCCDQRLGTADLKYTIATENCADRAALSDGVRDIITAQTANTQRILDQLCQDKIDSKNEKIAELQNQVNMQNLAASQAAQTAQLLADNARQTQDVENYIRPQINPAYVVPNPYAYNFLPTNGWSGCGCNSGCGNF